jgi:hypothetical protein
MQEDLEGDEGQVDGLPSLKCPHNLAHFGIVPPPYQSARGPTEHTPTMNVKKPRIAPGPFVSSIDRSAQPTTCMGEGGVNFPALGQQVFTGFR